MAGVGGERAGEQAGQEAGREVGQRPARLGLLLLAGWCLVAVAAVAGLVFGAPRPTALCLAVTATVGTLGVCGIIAWGMISPRSGVFAAPILRGPPRPGLCALTFDDGPHPTSTPRVLELIEASGQQASFFVIGRRAQEHPELVQEIVRRGHELGNHSYHHRRLTTLLPLPALSAELAASQELLTRLTGRPPRYFRPPVGLFGPRVEAAARRVGLVSVAWSGRGGDGVRTAASPEQVLGRMLRALAPGAILLLHDGAEQEGRTPVVAEVLPRLLAAMREQGLRSVTLGELLRPPAASVRR